VRRPLLVVIAALAMSCANPPSPSAPAAPTSAPSKPDAGAELRSLLHAEWEHHLEVDPIDASRLGDHRYDAEWGDHSLAAQAKEYAHNEEVLKKLAAIPKDRLSDEDRLNLELFANLRQEARTRHELALDLFPIDHREGIQNVNELADELRFTTTLDYENWAARVGKMGTYVDQTLEVRREG